MPTATLQTFEELRAQLQSASVVVNDKRMEKAWQVAREAYAHEDHWTGVTLMEHVLKVLNALVPFHPDEETVIACLLHHILQCKYWTVVELEQNFGPKVRELVSGVHLLSHVTLQDRRVSIDDLKLMLLTVSEDIRTIVIVLCERLALLQQASSTHAKYRRRVAQDALQLFAPVAARLGIYSLKHSIEKIAFPICYTQDAERIQEQVLQVHDRYGSFLQDCAEEIQSFLKTEGITCNVECREKQPYSVFRKMNEKSITHVSDVYDYFAIRVMVENEAECYQALGLLHKVGRPVGNRFKDYIAFPKPNGYRSLHTTLAQLPGAPSESIFVEVQVRTDEMDREANYGVAAHWMYKEAGTMSGVLKSVQLHDVLASQDTLEEPNQLADHIFVLTPAGDVIELPEGATPLDFAFQVHTGLGLAFRGARVNGSIVSMDCQLENGDIVEIMKHKEPRPSPQWLQLLKMASSRSKLKQFLYAQKRPELLSKGREMVNKELRKHSLPPLDTSLSALRMYQGEALNMHDREDILVKIGQGSEKPHSLLPKLGLLLEETAEEEQEEGVQQSLRKRTEKELVIEGGVPLPNRFAKCCKPEEWPREGMIGVVNRKGQVIVHRNACGMLRNANPERKLRVWWEN